MNGTILDIFRIDRLGKGIFTKILFTLALLVGCSVYFFPLGDTDFTRFISWAQDAMNDPEILINTTYMEIPLTVGNLIYLGHILASDLFILLCSVIYSAVYIRQYRLEHKLKDPGDSGYLIPPKYLKASSVGKLMLRMVIVFCFSLVLMIPASFVMLYLFLIFIIILPCVSMYPACYLSGDTDFFGSFSEMVKVTKGYYVVNARNMFLIITLYFLGRWITSAMMSVIPSAAYVSGPLITVFLALSYGRYVGMIYCRMREVPGGLRVRI